MLTAGTYIADRYEILEKIGSGGMADVYKAKDHILGRYVAVKILKQELAEDMNFVTKFRTEAQSAAGLEHPNIVNIYDVGSQNRMYYIVMEFVEGITLKTYIQRKGQLSYKEAVSIAIQVGKGIEAAHNKKIIHRDIKPQNIIISKEGQVKVTDFGIARVSSHTTIHSEVMGSVHYTSPEQARNGFIDDRSDIYSLGIVLYEMVTGRVPFDGDTTVAVAIQHLQEDMVPPDTYAKELPISVLKIIQKCTQKSPDRRYPNMAALLADLKRSLTSPDEDFVTMPPLSQEQTRKIKGEELEAIKRETPITPAEQVGEELEEAEEDDGGFLNPKMERAVTIMGIVAAVIIVMIILFVIGNTFGLFRFSGGFFGGNNNTAVEEPDDAEVQVPSILGKTVQEATAELNRLNLGIRNSNETIASEQYPAGRIAAQDPAPGEMVSRNTRITYTLSSGVAEVEIPIPDVVGLTEMAARSKLEDAGFTPRREYRYSDRPVNEVVEQSPEAGSKGKEGDTVTYFLSQGRQSVQVPDVRNRSEAEAKSMIEAAKLTVGNVTSSPSDNISSGNVISQDPAAGRTMDQGSSVNIVVSTGPRTQYYSYSGSIQQRTSNDVSARVQLIKSDGNEVIPINGQRELTITSFPTSIRAENIANANQGTLVIVWTVQETTTTTVPDPDDPDGEPQTTTDTREETDTRTVFFNAQ